MAFLSLCLYTLFAASVVQQCIATIPLDQIGQCKSSFYENRIQNLNLKNLGGELTNVYITSEYQPTVVCDKQTFVANQDGTYSLVTQLVSRVNGVKETVSETAQVESNSDGTFTITESSSDGTELKHTLYGMFSGTSGGLIFYLCNPDGTSTNDLRSLALPTRGIAYRAYGISEMILKDRSLGFSGSLRKLQRC